MTYTCLWTHTHTHTHTQQNINLCIVVEGKPDDLLSRYLGINLKPIYFSPCFISFKTSLSIFMRCHLVIINGLSVLREPCMGVNLLVWGGSGGFRMVGLSAALLQSCFPIFTDKLIDSFCPTFLTGVFCTMACGHGQGASPQHCHPLVPILPLSFTRKARN